MAHAGRPRGQHRCGWQCPLVAAPAGGKNLRVHALFGRRALADGLMSPSPRKRADRIPRSYAITTHTAGALARRVGRETGENRDRGILVDADRGQWSVFRAASFASACRNDDMPSSGAACVVSLWGTGEAPWIVVANDGPPALIPREHAEREPDSEPRVSLHQRRAGAWAAEDGDHVAGQVHTASHGGCRVIDLRENHQASLRDGTEQAGHLSPCPDELTAASIAPDLTDRTERNGGSRHASGSLLPRAPRRRGPGVGRAHAEAAADLGDLECRRGPGAEHDLGIAAADRVEESPDASFVPTTSGRSRCRVTPRSRSPAPAR